MQPQYEQQVPIEGAEGGVGPPSFDEMTKQGPPVGGPPVVGPYAPQNQQFPVRQVEEESKV
jgi:hypothetical protein